MIMSLFNKYLLYDELLYQQIYPPPFDMSIGYPLYHISNIDCVCHCHYEWNCIIGTTCFIFDRLDSYIWYLKLKCTIHARGRLLVPALCLSAMLWMKFLGTKCVMFDRFDSCIWYLD